MEMTQEQKQEIINKLNEKGVNLPCPRCGNKAFNLLDGYFNQSIQDNLHTTIIGGKTVPSIITACTNCGYLSQHALGALGLLEKESKKENKKDKDNG